MDGNIQKITSVIVGGDLKSGHVLMCRGYVENDTITYTDGIAIDTNKIYKFAEGQQPVRIKLETIKRVSEYPTIDSVDLTYNCDAKLENNYDSKPTSAYKAYVDDKEVPYEDVAEVGTFKKVIKLNNLEIGDKVKIKVDDLILGYGWAGKTELTIDYGRGAGSYLFNINEYNLLSTLKV